MWKDPETGLMCKGRIDLLTTYEGDQVVCDLKSTRDASPHSFARDMALYGYFRSLAWYQLGLAVLTGEEFMCALVAVEKQPPYATVVYELDDRSVAIGQRHMRNVLTDYAKAVADDYWPGYGEGLVPLGLPAWVSVD